MFAVAANARVCRAMTLVRRDLVKEHRADAVVAIRSRRGDGGASDKYHFAPFGGSGR